MVCDTAAPPADGKGKLNVDLQMRLDRRAEWKQMFNESWRYLRDFFYDPTRTAGTGTSFVIVTHRCCRTYAIGTT